MNPRKKHIIVLFFKNVLILTFFISFKLFITNSFNGNDKKLNNYDDIIKESLNYKEILVKRKEYQFNRPEFENEKLNQIVDEYIETNACTDLNYDIVDLGNNRVSMYLNCKEPFTITYDYANDELLTIKKMTKNYERFISTVKKLLLYKYPKFVVEDIDFDEAIYHIEQNMLTLYYTSSDYGELTLKINNNEIKNLMNYDMSYDDAYENEMYKLDPLKKAIAFTFDDGPSGVDIHIIDALVDAHATATFYMVGNRMYSFPKSIKKMLENDMEVGNHTYDHKSLSGLTDEEIKEEVTKTNDVFFEMTGKNLTSLRPSYGAINRRVQRQVGMPIILWDIDTLDWKNRNADKISAEILANATDGSIVLMHSLYNSTLEAVQKVLPELYKMGYQVVSVEKLAQLKGYKLSSGDTIRNMK